MTRYRTYDSQWNKTGWAVQPSYPGQAPATRDWPIRCPGGDHRFEIVTLSQYVRGWLGICRCGHEVFDQSIGDLT